MSKTIYIKAVMVVFLLLILSRIPALVYGTADGVVIISSIVELVFLVWGIVIIAHKKKTPDSKS